MLRLWMQRLVNLFALGVLDAFLKLREIAADKAGFGSEFTYRQAKTVVQNASPELKAQGEVQARSMTFAPTFTTAAALSRDLPESGEGAKFGTTFFSVFVTPADR